MIEISFTFDKVGKSAAALGEGPASYEPLITGFKIAGHSGYSESGTDIVCAAVTSAVTLCECTLNDVLKLDIPFLIDPLGAAIEMRPDNIEVKPGNIEKGSGNIEVMPGKKDSSLMSEAAQAVLRALRLVLKRYSIDYPEYIKILHE